MGAGAARRRAAGREGHPTATVDGWELQNSQVKTRFPRKTTADRRLGATQTANLQQHPNTHLNIWSRDGRVNFLFPFNASVRPIHIIHKESFLTFGTRCARSEMNGSDFGGQRLKFSVSEGGLGRGASNLARIVTCGVQTFVVHSPKSRVCWWVEMYNREATFRVLVFRLYELGRRPADRRPPSLFFSVACRAISQRQIRSYANTRGDCISALTSFKWDFPSGEFIFSNFVINSLVLR